MVKKKAKTKKPDKAKVVSKVKKSKSCAIVTIIVGALVAGIPWLDSVAVDAWLKWVLAVVGILVLLKGVKDLKK